MDLKLAEKMARELMDQHGLRDWRFQWDNARRRFGCCHGGRKLITMSSKLTSVNAEAEVLNTILHEIAHALVRQTYTSRLQSIRSHGPEWKAMAKQLGCTPRRCYGSEVVAYGAARAKATPRCRICGKSNLRPVRYPQTDCWYCKKYNGAR